MIRSTVPMTVAMCAGLAATYAVLPDHSPTGIYFAAAIGVMAVLGAGLFFEARGQLRTLIRTDVVMLLALYGLTLVEFLFPQELVESQLDPQSATQSVELLLLGFGGILIGRCFAGRRRHTAVPGSVQLSSKATFVLFVTTFCVSYLYMLSTVDFDPAKLVHEMMGPRFSQPWSRGALAEGLKDILSVAGELVRYLVPLLAGCILADRHRHSLPQLVVVAAGLAFTLFCAFAAGTRNVFAIYIILFLGAYVIFSPKIGWKRIAVLSAVASAVLGLSAYYMLQFRTVGLEAFINGETDNGFRTETLFVDNNLPVIGILTNVFPERTPYLGWEMITWSLLHPVPRMLWPGKPEKLSVEAADVLRVKNTTITSTFVGESYMMGGYAAVFGVALLFGWAAGWWDSFGHDLRSNINVVLYASGFFAATLSMRSMIWTTTAILPTIAIWLYLKLHEIMARPRMIRPADRLPRI
jgi:energy-coupling factor transporter transmembrane protein EcfT